MVRTFSIKRLVVMVGWAESLSWSLTTEREVRIPYLLIQKVTECESGNTAYGIIIGPLTIMAGLA